MDILSPNENIRPYVRQIMIMEGEDSGAKNNFPFYADGYPGLMFSRGDHKVKLWPKNKFLSDLYLYGQTIEPISMEVNGRFKFIIYRLYPSSVKLLLNVNPKDLNDDCYDLFQIDYIDIPAILIQLQNCNSTEGQLEILDQFILDLIKHTAKNTDKIVTMALNTIISAKGKIPIKHLRKQLYLSERTFERRFSKEIGITPKQFARIIQFSFSKNQLSESDYENLTALSYDTGFADQSHFIRTFKKYTGKTPKEYQSLMAI